MSTLKICAKCSDMCSCLFTDSKGKVHESESYVPSGIGIGDFYGDYVEMEIDMSTGQIFNWKPVSDAKIIKALKEA